MPESDYYETTYRRNADYPSDDEARYKQTTVRRYKVGRDGVERSDTERTQRVDEYDYDEPRRPSRTERRVYVPEGGRSSVDVTERRTERRSDFHDDRDDIARSVEKRREIVEHKDDGFGGDRSHRIVYEKTKEVDRDRDRDRDNYSHVSKRTDRDDQIIVERYSEDRREDYGPPVERWHKETEYYEPAPPPPAPIIIRSKPQEQRIFVQEAPAPAPVILPQPQASPGVIVIREKEKEKEREVKSPQKDDRRDEDYYYERRERREITPYRDGRDRDRDEELIIARVDRHDEDGRRRHRHHHHHRASKDYATDGELSDNDDYIVHRTVTRREVSPPESSRRLQLAEGALAGAGIGALLGTRRNDYGELPEHRGRKVLAGAALGAISTEAVKRAHSAYQDRFTDERSPSRGRERSQSRHHSTLKTGLGIAAAALAVAGAAKYMQSNRVEKEERNRGRSLHRYNSEESFYSRTPSRHTSRASRRSRSRTSRTSRSRASSVAKAAAGTAAVAGLVHHYRSKSRKREGKSRSHSRIRTGAEIVGAGLAGAAAKKLYDKHQDKKEHERELADEEADERSRSRSRSAPPPPAGASRTPDPAQPESDPELGLVEYGAQPLYMGPDHHSEVEEYRESTSRSYDSAADDSGLDGGRGHRSRRRHGDRHPASRGHARRDESDEYYESDTSSEEDKKPVSKTKKKKDEKRSRSRSRLREFAAASAGAAAAAIGLKKYKDHEKKREESQHRSRDREREREDEKRRRREKARGQDREPSRTYRDDYPSDYYDEYDPARPQSPAHASGGAYYGPPDGQGQQYNGPPQPYTVPPPQQYTAPVQPYPDQGPPPPGPPPASRGIFMQHPNDGMTDLHEPLKPAKPYDPRDYTDIPGAPLGGVAPGGPVQPSAPPPTSGGLRPSPPPVPGPPPGNSPYMAPPPPPPPADHLKHEDGDEHVSLAAPVSQDGATLPPESSRPSKVAVKKQVLSPANSGDDTDGPAKSVVFVPLSPQSTRTLRRHHAQTKDGDRSSRSNSSDSSVSPIRNLDDQRSEKTSDGYDDGASSHSLVPYTGSRSRRATDPSSDRPLSLRRRSRRGYSPGSEDSEGDGAIEELPDRFDSQGHPLDGSSGDRRGQSVGGRRRSSRWASRNGDFVYNGSRSHGQGHWSVGGTDAETVERMAENMRGLIDGIGKGAQNGGGWLGMLGGVIEGLSGRLLSDDRGYEVRDRDRLRDRDRDRDRDRYLERERPRKMIDDDRKRKRRNSFHPSGRDPNRDERDRDGHDRRSASVDSYDDHYREQDAYGHDARKKRRSWEN